MKYRQAFGGAVLPEQERTVRQVGPPGSAGEIHRFAERLFRGIKLPQGILGEAQVFINAALLRPLPQGPLEGRDRRLEAVSSIEGAAGEVPGIEITRVQALRGLEKALGGLPSLERGTDAARQHVPLRVAGVESDRPVGFVKRGLKLVEVQQRGAQEHADIGTIGIERQILAKETHGFGGAQRTVGGVGLRQQAVADDPAPSPAVVRSIARRACTGRAICGADYASPFGIPIRRNKFRAAAEIRPSAKIHFTPLARLVVYGVLAAMRLATVSRPRCLAPARRQNSTAR